MAYTGLTPTDVLRYIKRMIGAIAYPPEIDDEEMMQTVFQTTLPTFSRYFPYYFRILVGEKDEKVSGSQCYILPNVDNLEIIGVAKLNVGNYYNYVYNTDIAGEWADPFGKQLINDFESMYRTPTTFHYLPPNHIEIHPRLWNQLSACVTVKAVHPKHLKTIKMSLRDEFLQLALLDVLESLYPYRKRFESINSPYGDINLFMDQVERAHEDRSQLLERFRRESIKEPEVQKIWFA